MIREVSHVCVEAAAKHIAVFMPPRIRRIAEGH